MAFMTILSQLLAFLGLKGTNSYLMLAFGTIRRKWGL